MRPMHRMMFGKFWKWAGNFRNTDKNTGAPNARIGIDLRELCDGVMYWTKPECFEADGIAARLQIGRARVCTPVTL